MVMEEPPAMHSKKMEGDIVKEDFNTEEYDKITENAFVSVMSNPVSTFSVDVDNAAYSNIRRFLTDNQMPYKDVVRIEEMINYFDYSYPQPTDEHPFSVSMEMGECYWNNSHYLVQIGYKIYNHHYITHYLFLSFHLIAH